MGFFADQLSSLDDYNIVKLEQTVEKYGFELDDLDITYFSEE